MAETAAGTNRNYVGRRALKNTLLLYMRMFACMAMGFFATRFLLKSLGAAHFGLANVLTSIVSLFGIITSPLGVAALRFSAAEMGCSSPSSDNVSKMFSLLLVVYSMLVAGILVAGTPLILWIFYRQVNIAPGDVGIGLAYMLLAMAALIIELMKVPFWAMVIAHEDMNFFSWVSIIDGLLRIILFWMLGMASLPLVMYGVVLCFIALVNLLSYMIFTRYRYRDFRFLLFWDWPRAREIIVFALYQMGGGISTVVCNSGINIILNNFFGARVNAARGVATQVSAGLSGFAQNLLTAVNPQIIKTFSAKEYDVSMSLVIRTSKMAFYLNAMIAVPCILCAPFLCRLWLGTPPEFTVVFVRLVLVQMMVNSFTDPLMTLINASGKIALAQVVLGGAMLLPLPVSYVLLRMGFQPPSVFVVAIVCSALCIPLRLWLVWRVTKFPVVRFCVQVLLSSGFTLLLAMPFVLLCMHFIRIENLLICAAFAAVWCVIWCVCVLYAGLNREERKYILNMLFDKLEHLGLGKFKNEWSNK